jgi:hypothetical protein
MEEMKLEKYSSAITLSDMEVFVFPQLMSSLVLANIMSPIIWKWREDDCFKKLEGKSPYRKLMRLRQFIMDEYEFNLDLETWGLTSHAAELQRFASFILPEQISQSNALFGYEGDKYYFDVDIRKHFGLDKYDQEVIPYWKTETVEAMNAFRYKSGYSGGAGECVSLSALYAAAAFIVCDIPLEDIFMILTPLHSQNFIDVNDGVLTNNRRLVTKAMWFNGTAISDKAQRALRNERITTVAHCTGYSHCLYEDVTIDKKAYGKFTEKLSKYLTADMDMVMFANFLRSKREYQKFFQICRQCHGNSQFIPAELLFKYEHGSNYRIGDHTHEKLIADVADEDFVGYQLPGRIRCDEFENFLRKKHPNLGTPEGKKDMIDFMGQVVVNSEKLVSDLIDFIHIEPLLPSSDKKYLPSEPLCINPSMSRDQIIEYLQGMRGENETAELAFYAYRDMESTDWQPFIKAAVERNPVTLEKIGEMSVEQAYQYFLHLPGESIYEGKRLALPDEVVNFGRGDGVEKAFALANVIKNRNSQESVEITIEQGEVAVKTNGSSFLFESCKEMRKNVIISKVFAAETN